MSQSDAQTDIELAEALAEVLVKNKLGEIEYLRKHNSAGTVKIRMAMQPLQTAPMPGPQPPVASTSVEEPASETPPSTETAVANLPDAVTSPMVGTVYLQPEPDAPPFVMIGQQVVEGDTLLIVEAMKTMNHIPSPRSGTVRRILVENSSIVEFGSPLVVIS